jgi:hypothetical protein
VAEGARQLGSVDAVALSRRKIRLWEVQRRLAPSFSHTFGSLYDIMVAQEMKLRAKGATQTPQLHSQYVLSSSIRTPPPRSDAQLPEPSTPDQPAPPKDPKWSGSSAASQDEEATKQLLYSLLFDTMSMLAPYVQEITWQMSGIDVELAHTYS